MYIFKGNKGTLSDMSPKKRVLEALNFLFIYLSFFPLHFKKNGRLIYPLKMLKPPEGATI